MDGVAGTLDALRRKLLVRRTVGSSRPEPPSSKTSRSVRPEYLNFVPHENKPPPVTTGASVDFGNVKNSICSIEHRHTCLQDALVGHLKPTVCFF